MSPDYLKKLIDRQFSDWMGVSPHRMMSDDEVCQVKLPILEPSGDVVSVYVIESDGGVVIHDGGHISGLLFESRRNGPTKQDREAVQRILSDSGLKRDPETGLVNVETTEDGLRYWLMELGRIIALTPALVPTSFPTRRRTYARRKIGRTAYELTERLIKEGFSHAIKPQSLVRGLTNRPHLVDLSYDAFHPPFEGGKKNSNKIVHVLAVDMDVAKPLAKADRSIAVANDLAWSVDNSDEIGVSVVYSFGKEDWCEEPAAKLMQAAGKNSLFSSYSWDDEEKQSELLTRVGQDLKAYA